MQLKSAVRVCDSVYPYASCACVVCLYACEYITAEIDHNLSWTEFDPHS